MRSLIGIACGGAAMLVLAACQVLDPAPGGISTTTARARESSLEVRTEALVPPTRIETVVDDLHGVQIKDDYRWLEGDNSDPKAMGKSTPEVAAWTDAQNAYTRGVLDTLPYRTQLEERLRPLMEVGSVSTPIMRGNRYFYSKREGNQNQSSIFVRDGHAGEPRLLLDPAKIDETGLTTISWYEPSRDGKLLAYGTYRAGDENSTLRLLEVESGTVQPLEIPGKVSDMSWLPDGSGFVYRNLWDASNPYAGQVMFHEMGKPVAEDRQILRQFKPEEDAKLATTYGPGGAVSDDGKWLVLGYATDTRNNDLFVADFAQWKTSGKLTRISVAQGQAASFAGDVHGDVLYMLTTLDAPNGRIVAVDLKNPGKDKWKVLVPQNADGGVIQGFKVVKDILCVTYLKNASSSVDTFDLTGKFRQSLRLPGIGSATVAAENDRYEAYLNFTSYNYPSTVFRVDLSRPGAQPELWERPAVPVDPSTVVVKQEWYKSKDGTKVSMFIVHRKGLKMHGNNPTILYGYGGFKVSLTPTFNAPLFSWFEDGGVYVVANLRGGGEYGDAWHEAGRKQRKQNVYDDFASAAEFLVERGYTSASKLAIMGGSNGGLLTGTLVTQRPDLFKAAIVAVPLLDMLRFQNFLMARYWVPEYGSAEVPEDFDVLIRYSPYQNVRARTRYPAVLLTAGENDSRVHPLHARKMAAALQAATTSDPSAEPILLWVDKEAGHGQGKPLNLRIRDAADARIFLMWQLGMLDDRD